MSVQSHKGAESERRGVGQGGVRCTKFGTYK